MMKTQRDADSQIDEYYKVIPQPFSRLLLELRCGISSHIFSTYASSITMLDALVHILRQGNVERAVAYRRVNFRFEPCERHRMVTFLEFSSSVGEEAKAMRTTTYDMQADLTGGRTDFKFLLTVTEEPVNFFALDSCASRPSFKVHLYFGGLADDGAMNLCFFWRRKLDNWCLNGPTSAGFLDSSLTTRRVSNDKKWEVDWSSLPVLPLWNIMDRLDIFDNRRLGAVCRDWWSASVGYPKKLYRVGDGKPWICNCNIKNGMKSPTWEFISVSKKRRFEVTLPEFATSRALFSDGGWILLQTGGFSGSRGEPGSWCIVNLFTKDKIEFPKRGGNNARCRGLFKLGGDGCPDRVYLIIPESPYQLRINTARPGDKEWASHNFPNLERTFGVEFIHFAIGDTVYCQGPNPELTVFSLANNSVKALLPPPSLPGFITEHQGELLHIEPAVVGSRRRIKPIVVHKYDDASSSWEELKHNPVMGMSWYQSYGDRVVISTKGRGRGTKSYQLFRKIKDSKLTRHKYVSVSNLLTGKRRTLSIPFPEHYYLFWVAIG